MLLRLLVFSLILGLAPGKDTTSTSPATSSTTPPEPKFPGEETSGSSFPTSPATPTNPGESTSSPQLECREGEFMCPDRCIYMSWVCDGYEHCSDGSDEVDCPTEGKELTTETTQPKTTQPKTTQTETTQTETTQPTTTTEKMVTTEAKTTEIVELERLFRLSDKNRYIITEAGRIGLLIYNGGTVCDDGFNNYAANAVCKEMGFERAMDWTSGYFLDDIYEDAHFQEYRNLPITMDDVNCQGDNWEDCTFITSHNCGHSEDVQLACEGGYLETEATTKPEATTMPEATTPQRECREGEFRCPDRCIYMSWVCDGYEHCSDGSDEADCPSITQGIESTTDTSQPESTTEQIVTTETETASTTGSETSATSVTTQQPTTQTPDSLFELLNETSSDAPVQGLLLYRGGSVCDDGFDKTTADAICRELGFARNDEFGSEAGNDEFFSLYVSYEMARLARPYRIKLDNVDCPEPVWANCSYKTQDHDCRPEEKIFLKCTNEERVIEEDRFSLVDESGNIITEAGRKGLLLFNDGTVCDDNFNTNAAEAICRKLGFDGQMSWTSGLFISGDADEGYSQEIYDAYISLPIKLDDVNCYGYDWDYDCTFQRTHNCGHSEDVQLICSGALPATESPTDPEPANFQLVNEDGDIVGAGVEALLTYQGGTVCDDYFSDNAATAICREMGFSGAESWSSGLRYDRQSSMEIALDNVDCSDDDWDSCEYRTDHDCGHSEDIFLRCIGSCLWLH